MTFKPPIKPHTRSIQVTRGQTCVINETVRDTNCNRVDLTGAKAYWEMQADAKSPPILKLTSTSPAEAGWVLAVVIADQTDPSQWGDYVVTLTDTMTATLTALGHDDPWIHQSWIVLPDGSRYPHIQSSELDLYPEVGAVP